MVALCRDHHPEADAGAFTIEQLRDFKRVKYEGARPVGARISWMRQELVAVVGNFFYVDTPVAVRIRSDPVVWFERDEVGCLLVNLQQLSIDGPRMVMRENFWITDGASASHMCARRVDG